MSIYIQSNQVVSLPNTNLTISAVDTGKIMITPQTVGATNITFTLPSLAAGLHYRFINGAPAALSGTVLILSQTANSIFGSILTGPTLGVALKDVNGQTQTGFLTGISIRGDYIDLTCDGTNWYIDGRSRVANGVQ